MHNFLQLSIPSKIALFISLSCFLSLIIAIAGGSEFQFTDVNDVLVLLRLFIITVAVRSYVHSVIDIQKILLFFYTSIFISVVIAALQYFNAGPLAESLTSLYSEGDSYLKSYSLPINLLRVVSTFGNPNETALFFTLGSLCSIYAITNRIGHISCNIAILFTFIIILVFATGSRSGVIIFIISIISYLFSNTLLSNKNYRLYYPFILIILIISLSIIFNLSFIENIQVPSRLMDLFSDGHFGTNIYEAMIKSRIYVWTYSITQIQYYGQYLVGNGPGPGFVIDSEYLYVLFTQGMVGLILYIMFLFYPILSSIKIWSNEFIHIASFTLAAVLSFAIYAVLAPVIYSAKAGPALAFIIGLWVVLLKLENNHSECKIE